MSEIKPGDIVEWSSQSHGTVKTKRGKVIAIVPKGTRQEFDFLRDLPGSRIKFTTIGFGVAPSKFDRALIEVPRATGNGNDYYAPRIEWLRKVEMDD